MLHATDPLQHGREGQHDGESELLLMVGYSEEQLALSIAAHVRAGCRKIMPFSTLEAWTSVQCEVEACLLDLGLSRNKDYQLELLQTIEPNDPANVFRKVMNWVRDHPARRPADVQDLSRAEQLVQRCDCWMPLRYDDKSLQNYKLHRFFVEAHNSQAKSRDDIERLLQRDRVELFHEYVVDEYWRLRVL